MHLHIDCSFGVSGDMLLAALVDAGADLSAVRSILERLPLHNFTIGSEKVLRGGVAALHLDVEDLTKKHDHKHSHDHPHVHPHSAPHQQDHEHHAGHAHSHDKYGPHRHLGDLLQLLNPEILPERVRTRAEKVFRIIAEAEAGVHSRPIEQVHFHEISGIDTAVDVIGVCVALDLLNAYSISASVPAAGSGMIMCDHGVFSVPAPATLEILKSRNIPWRQGGDGERMTPTGAALLAGLVDSFGSSPELTVVRIGYGAGTRDFADSPNLLRVIIGKPSQLDKTRVVNVEMPGEYGASGVAMPLSAGLLFPPEEVNDDDGFRQNSTIPDQVVEFQLVVDDMTPESVAYLQELCLAGGAVDAYSLPAIMKKGRLGHELTVLCPPVKAAEIADLLWRNSSTFGIRFRETSRLTLAREIRSVVVEGQTVRIKIGWLGDEIIRRQPEYEDCKAAAQASGKPLDHIFRLAAQAAADLA